MSTYRNAVLSAVLLSVSLFRGDPSLADTAEARRDFVTAMQRMRLHDPDLADSPSLQSYAIYDYLVAARLRRDLISKPEGSLDTAIDVFLQDHAGQPVTKGLRRDWLENLALRRRWDWFLPRSQDVTEPALACDRLQARLETGDAGLAAAALLRWMAPQRPPVECASVFLWLRQQGLLTPALAESRARGALAAGNARLAREFAADVPIDRRAPLIQWSDLLDTPRITLNVLTAHPSLPVETEALVAGFDKLAHSDPLAAFDLLPRLLERSALSPAQRTQLKHAAALGAAYDHDPRAIEAFGALSTESMDGQAQEWRARAALWWGDYRRARAWIEQMPSSLAAQPRWKYWHARAVAATDGPEAAVALFKEIAGMRDYYGYLAADRLNLAYDLNIRPSPLDAATQSALLDEPGMLRAHELFECDMVDEAAVEWNAALEGADAARKVQAALLASRWGWYAQSITTLAQTGEFDDVNLRYPRPYLDAVSEGARVAQLPQDWLLAIMRQESLFRKDAVSRADARGVMQMLLPTAAAVARRWHLASPARGGLFDPSVAIPLGAVYLRELLDRYGGQLAVSLAAYNAGPTSVARWLPPQPMDPDIWLENIPYNETRAYVQHILEHIIAFASVRGVKPPRLDALLATVEPAPTL